LIQVGPGTQVPGTFSFDSGDTVIIFKPSSYLLPDTQYVWSLTQDIESIDNVPLDKPMSGSFITASTVDTVSPKVYVSPADGAADVPTNTTIMLTFSEPINPILVNSSTLIISNQGSRKEGIISVGAGNRVVTFIPISNFSPNSQVNITLSGKVTDMAGNPIAGSSGIGTDFVSSFATATTTDIVPPRVLNINPPDKAAGVNTNTTISVTFNEPINPLTVNDKTFSLSIDETPYPGQISFSNQNNTATLTPDQPLPNMSMINITLAAGISDTAGNAMPLPFTSTFTTQAGIDNFQPSVIKTDPYNGQTNVPLNTSVRIEFDERINPLTVNSSTFYLRCYDCSINTSGSISVASDGLSATFTPDEMLLADTRYYIIYTSGIEDIAGNPLLNPSSLGNTTFTTGSELKDTTPPQVVKISPAMGATGVPVNVVVTIQFSEALDATTVDGQSIVVTAGGIPVEGKITLEQGNTVVRFIPANLYYFNPNTFYEVTVTTAVRDTAGNNMALPYNSSFTTGSDTDTAIPTVVSVNPANWSSNVPVDTNISVTFSEPINPVTINRANFRVSNYIDLTGSFSISADGRTVTFDPVYPLIAGGTNTYNSHYISLSNIEDLSGNRIAGKSYSFRTALAAGTDYSSLPTQATVVANPEQLFADGQSIATVTISNINVNGTLVPNGTKIAVTAEPVFNSNSSGGEILGGTPSTADPRFKIFTTLGGSVTITYRAPDLPNIPVGSYKYAYIQVASIDTAESPVRQIGSDSILLYRGYSTSIYRNPTSMLANGTSWAQVKATIYGRDNVPVPAGMKIGVTADSVFTNSSGGVINGSDTASDTRFKIFTTIAGGIIEFTYTAPFMQSNQSGTAYIQLAQAGDDGQIGDFIGSKYINLNGSSGYTAPQPEVVYYSPANGQSNVGLNAPIVVSFSQPLDPSTVNSSNFSISGPSGSVSGTRTLAESIYGTDRVVIFVPDVPWVPNSTYYLSIYTGIKSASGNPLLSSLYTSFSTAAASDTEAPYVVGINPPDGAGNVATNSS
ncbi:MAG: Ig-like domain-containing protein, partial [Nitrospirota bacterium]